jgi:hypothetical protein
MILVVSIHHCSECISASPHTAFAKAMAVEKGYGVQVSDTTKPLIAILQVS